MSDLHALAANTVRVLAMDAVQNCGNGHPGMPMGMADVAVVLWREFMRHNPQDPEFWEENTLKALKSRFFWLGATR